MVPSWCCMLMEAVLVQMLQLTLKEMRMAKQRPHKTENQALWMKLVGGYVNLAFVTVVGLMNVFVQWLNSCCRLTVPRTVAEEIYEIHTTCYNNFPPLESREMSCEMYSAKTASIALSGSAIKA